MFQDWVKSLKNEKIEIIDEKLNSVIQKYSFHYISEQLSLEQYHIFEQNLKLSKIIAISYYEKDPCFIIGFKDAILFVNQTSLNLVHFIFSKGRRICFLNNSKYLFDQSIHINYNEATNTNLITKLISEFNKHLLPKKMHNQNKQVWIIVTQCISGYLIQNAYHKLDKDRISEFYNQNHQISNRIFDEDEYVELHPIGSGSLFIIYLTYLIDSEELVVLKKPNILDDEIEKLIERETKNFKSIRSPHIPKFYGTTKKNGYIMIEYINGHTLNDENLSLSDEEKYAIIYQLIDVFKYIHKHHFIYRDLKANNVMVDENKTLVLIDFDRMKSEEDKNNRELTTLSFLNEEFNSLNYTNKSDIYSIGKMINYIINEMNPNSSTALKSCNFEGNSHLHQIYNNCMKNNSNERPSSSQLIKDFCSFIKNKNIILNNNNSPTMQVTYGHIYDNCHEIDKSIHYLTLAANQNNSDAQNKLGYIYFSGDSVPYEINKGLYFFSLAANQNNSDAQYNLGCIYFSGESVPRDINKGLYFFSLAANQNNSYAQNKLGYIYFYGKSVPCDINKGLHYLSLAANQNNSNAQNNLGYIYFYGESVPCDINKGLHYLSLSANQNNSYAQYNLGYIYFSGESVPRDINKGLYYLSLSANQNNSYAQNKLGYIYFSGESVPCDINKGLHYLSLSANQNNSDAQYILGYIYFSGESVPPDINKGIYFFSLAANHNNSDAQFILGCIHLYSLFFTYDTNKSLYYLSLAANQNNTYAQCSLGYIYFYGKSVPRDINKGLHYFLLASNQNRNTTPNFFLGIFYHEGKYIERDIKKAVHFYKNASSFNDRFAKNNLGILYKNGFGNEVPKSWPAAEIYFLEAINQKNDYLSKYNLAHVYIFDEATDESIDKAIKYLVESSEQKKFKPSEELLCLVILKKYGLNIDEIIKELSKYTKNADIFISLLIEKVESQHLDDPILLEKAFDKYKNIDYLYNEYYSPIISSDIFKNKINHDQNIKKQNNQNRQKQITSEFYEGFGILIQ